jgi:hypothetical protein
VVIFKPTISTCVLSVSVDQEREKSNCSGFQPLHHSFDLHRINHRDDGPGSNRGKYMELS